MGSVPPNRRGVAAGTRMLLNNTGQTMAIAVAMVMLSTGDVARSAGRPVHRRETPGHTVDGEIFMRGFHLVFVFSAVTSVVAIICSSLRGAEHRPDGRASQTDAVDAASFQASAIAIQPTGRP